MNPIIIDSDSDSDSIELPSAMELLERAIKNNEEVKGYESYAKLRNEYHNLKTRFHYENEVLKDLWKELIKIKDDYVQKLNTEMINNFRARDYENKLLEFNYLYWNDYIKKYNMYNIMFDRLKKMYTKLNLMELELKNSKN